MASTLSDTITVTVMLEVPRGATDWPSGLLGYVEGMMANDECRSMILGVGVTVDSSEATSDE